MITERVKYPDGQISAKVSHLPDLADTKRIDIKQRINSYEDLFYVRSIVDAIGNEYDLHLTIPCMFAQRSDARFSPHQSHDLKLVAEVINSCGFKSVGIFDPHSNTSLDLVNNSYKISSFDQVFDVVTKHLSKDVILISPDAGAYKKLWKYSADLRMSLIPANKFRDKDGTIYVTIGGNVKEQECLIVDDLIDGGGTFISLAEQLKNQGASKVFLYASHAIFSKGVDVMCGPIDHIYCTNSYKNVEHKKVTQYKVI